MSRNHLHAAGEHELAEASEAITNVWQLVAIVLAKYGLIGIVLAYFGWQNWQQNQTLIRLTEQGHIAMTAITRATDELTRTVAKISPEKK